MSKNISKIYRRAAFIILAIIISGLLNVCLFVWQAKTAQLIQPLKFNLAYDNSGNCLGQSGPEPAQAINYPPLPIPECCLTRNRNFNAVINAASDKSAPNFTSPVISWTETAAAENNFINNTSQNIYPPPAALAMASTVMRE